ncbi:Lrp/AsnC family transcriptional regulator [Candidatus Woesearchaeota archaeon]|nr:Lrp/AsnC family transcriptional regulator [Candidatus Woesearchaeota archaeon]HIH25617.1 Lrp/AsnC family transcriptional regulator [Nanoarchaeota archaeon]
MLDKRELIILSKFRENSRESLTRMSKKISVPVSTIYEKLKGYEKSVIKRHTSLLDFSKLGFNTRATIILKVTKDNKDALKEFLLNNRYVNTFYKINNGYDFMIEAVFRELNEVESFVEELEDKYNVQDKKVYYIIDELKKEAFLSNSEYLKLSGDI